MVPITFLLADALDIDPVPLVIIEILVSNIGGTATLIGDPPNILSAGATACPLEHVQAQVSPRTEPELAAFMLSARIGAERDGELAL